jgi:tocopherol O-methyltransferase
MFTYAGVTRCEIRSHYDWATLFYRLLWGAHIHHGLWADEESASQAQLRLIERLAALADLQSRSHVLDVGCGMGGTAIHLARHRHCRVVGLTLSPVQRSWATVAAWLNGVGRQTRFTCEDAETAAIVPRSFDVVWSIECTEHLFDKARFFRRVADWLRPHGRTAICAWLAGDEPRSATAARQLHAVCEGFLCPSLGTARDYLAWIGDAGLEVRHFEDFSEKVAHTWQICSQRVHRYGVRGLARCAGPNMARFIDCFESILDAYRTGALRYGCFVAQVAK